MNQYFLLNTMFGFLRYLLILLRIAVLINCFVPYPVEKEGFFPMIKEIVDPLNKMFGKSRLGPFLISPIIIFTLIDILSFAIRK